MTGTMLTLRQVCEQLGISTATGRNWIRQGRLIPEDTEGHTARFSQEQLNRLQREIQNSDRSLQSRRNKSGLQGTAFYSEYLPADSPNRRLAKKVLEQAPEDAGRSIAQAARALIRQRVPELLPYAEATWLSSLANDSTAGAEDDLPSYLYVPGEDLLGLLYISARNLGARKSDGVYYTPARMVRSMMEDLAGSDRIPVGADHRILDPCCGTGNFLIHLPSQVLPEQIYGMDIDPEAVAIARWNLTLRYPETDPALWEEHIRIGDYLRIDDPTEFFGAPDFHTILGNPPWGSVYTAREKKEWNSRYACAEGRHVESCDLFLEQSLRFLKPHGYISFVLPEAVLAVGAHRGIRRILLNGTSIRHLRYAGERFYGVQCPCVCLTLEKTGQPMDTRGTVIDTEESTFVIRHQRSMTAERFSLAQTDEEYDILRKMREGSRVTLAGQAAFAMGIVTGDNRKYLRLRDPQEETEKGSEPMEEIIRGCEVDPYQIEAAKYEIRYAPEHFQQSAEESSYRAPEKILYRFIGDHPVAALDRQGRLTLNSCNILIPRIPGIPAAYVLALLNSRAAAFWWRKTYRTVKILRGQLEEFPLPVPEAGQLEEILELVAQIEGRVGRKVQLLRKLDHLLESMYGLTEEEIAVLEAEMPACRED